MSELREHDDSISKSEGHADDYAGRSGLPQSTVSGFATQSDDFSEDADNHDDEHESVDEAEENHSTHQYSSNQHARSQAVRNARHSSAGRSKRRQEQAESVEIQVARLQDECAKARDNCNAHRIGHARQAI